MRIHWLWLATRPGLSDRKKMAVLEAFPDPEDVYLAGEKELSAISGLTEEDIGAFASVDGIRTAEGSYSADFLWYSEEAGSDHVLF